jgi:hypothetical protein
MPAPVRGDRAHTIKSVQQTCQCTGFQAQVLDVSSDIQAVFTRIRYPSTLSSEWLLLFDVVSPSSNKKYLTVTKCQHQNQKGTTQTAYRSARGCVSCGTQLLNSADPWTPRQATGMAKVCRRIYCATHPGRLPQQGVGTNTRSRAQSYPYSRPASVGAYAAVTQTKENARPTQRAVGQLEPFNFDA